VTDQLTEAEEAWGCAALLAGLPNMGPRSLTEEIDRWGPVEAWARSPARAAGSSGAAADPRQVLRQHEERGVAILLRGDPDYPVELLDDLFPPPVLFARGDLSVLTAPRVAIVGTRRCTGAGAGIARALGRDLAAAGVAVVSGLALGIDGAAHRGALDDPEAPGAPIGVIGCGHDLPYPPRHADLWEAVAARGALLGEAPLGTRPAPWRFPARNRIIAALADLVVVVESHAGGGSLLTVKEAMDRDIDVMAVPGSVRSPASAGTNQLLADGCHPVRDADDVLVALGMVPGGRRTGRDARTPPDAVGRAVLDAFDWEPATLEHLALRTGRGVPDLALALHRLEADGWVSAQGPWYERVGRG
jgi:DNA processing protein